MERNSKIIDPIILRSNDREWPHDTQFPAFQLSTRMNNHHKSTQTNK